MQWLVLIFFLQTVEIELSNRIILTRQSSSMNMHIYEIVLFLVMVLFSNLVVLFMFSSTWHAVPKTSHLNATYVPISQSPFSLEMFE